MAMALASRKVLLLLSYACLSSQAAGQAPTKWEDKVDEQVRKVQSMQIQAPTMTEEDQYGYIMPDRYRCDSCKVVVYQLNEALRRKQLKSRRLLEWEIHEIFDDTCRSGFKGYGITLVDGENALNGPGLERKGVEPGMGAIQMGGETWEKRLGEICRKFVYDKVGEDELYDNFRTNGEVSQELCFKETRDCQLGPQALPKGKNNVKKTSEKRGNKSASRENAKAQTSKNKGEQDGSASPDEAIDVQTFFAKLASEHGLPTAEYTKKRSYQEWQQVLVRTAGRIFERSGTQNEKVVKV